MKNLVDQLIRISQGKNKKEQKSITNLIDRIQWFEKTENQDMLVNCVAEANL